MKATFHWLLIATSHDVGKIGMIQAHRKNPRYVFVNEMENFMHSDNDSPVIQDGIHALTQFVDPI